MLNTVTIALIAWAVAITLAIIVMIAVVVRRLRVIRERTLQVAEKKRIEDTDSECPQSMPPVRKNDVSVVNIDHRLRLPVIGTDGEDSEVEVNNPAPPVNPQTRTRPSEDSTQTSVILQETGSTTY